MARAALRDDLYAVHAPLTAQVLDAHRRRGVRRRPGSRPGRSADGVVVSRAVSTLEEICTDDEADLARMSVGLRVVRTSALERPRRAADRWRPATRR